MNRNGLEKRVSRLELAAISREMDAFGRLLDYDDLPETEAIVLLLRWDLAVRHGIWEEEQDLAGLLERARRELGLPGATVDEAAAAVYQRGGAALETLAARGKPFPGTG